MIVHDDDPTWDDEIDYESDDESVEEDVEGDEFYNI